MPYPQGRKELVFTTTGGSPFVITNATTVNYRSGPATTKYQVRALAFIQTSTGTAAPAFRFYLATGGANSTATITIVDVITTTTVGTGRGKIFYVDGLRTTVSEGTELFARVMTAATKVQGRLHAYVDVQPFDLLNKTGATESA